MTGKGDGLGATLRRERESRGIGLDELSRATKVRRVFLDALEEERWDALPAKVFVTGYLKAIAQHIGIEPSVLLSAYEKNSVSEAASLEPPSPQPPAKSVNWALAASGACAVAVAVALGWIYLEMRGAPEIVVTPPPAATQPQALKQQQPVPAAEAAAMQEPAPAGQKNIERPKAEQAPPEPAAVVPKAAAPSEAAMASPGAVATAPPVAAKQLPMPSNGIVLETVGPCWVELYRGQERLVFRQMKAGERASFEGSGFRLTVGDASVARLFYDKKAIALPDKAGTVVKDMNVGGASSEPSSR